MQSLLPVLLFIVAGMLTGGALSLHRQGTGRAPVIGVAALAVLAALGGVLWLLPDGTFG